MSKTVRYSVVVVVSVSLVGGVLLSCGNDPLSQLASRAIQEESVDPSARPGESLLADERFAKLPVPKLIVAPAGEPGSWKWAPAERTVRVGTALRLFQKAPSPFTITWTGAEELQRGVGGSAAHCSLDEVGVYTMKVVVQYPGGAFREQTCVLHVVDVPRDFQIRGISPVLDPLDRDEISPAEVTMDRFGEGSIAQLRQVARGHYRTSVHRPVLLQAQVGAPEMAPFVEWYIDDELVGMGETLNHVFAQVGVYTVSAGALGPIPAHRNSDVQRDHHRPYGRVGHHP